MGESVKERTGMSHEDAGREGGRVTVKIMSAKARAKSLANRAERRQGKAAAAEEAAKPPAPLAAWMTDPSLLPKRPPGRTA